MKQFPIDALSPGPSWQTTGGGVMIGDVEVEREGFVY
jgi:hypothetical protein